MLPTQYQIEQAAGITDAAIAKHLMDGATAAAKSAMNLLAIQCKGYDAGGFELLKAAVADCRREMQVAPASQ